MTYEIALIPGDGIGREVIPEGVRVLETLSKLFAFDLRFTEFPFSCAYYLEHGKMMPEDGIEQLSAFDAILLGAVGGPKWDGVDRALRPERAPRISVPRVRRPRRAPRPRASTRPVWPAVVPHGHHVRPFHQHTTPALLHPVILA